MIRVCEVCGQEYDESWMISYNTGRRTHWLCWDCYKVSQREANSSDHYRQKKLHQIHLARKKNK